MWEVSRTVLHCYTTSIPQICSYSIQLQTSEKYSNTFTEVPSNFSSDGDINDLRWLKTSKDLAPWLAKGCEADWFRYLLGVSQIFCVSRSDLTWTDSGFGLWIHFLGRYEPKSPRAKHVVGTLGTLVWNGKTPLFHGVHCGFSWNMGSEISVEGDINLNEISLNQWYHDAFSEISGLIFDGTSGYLAPEALQGDYSPALGTLSLIRGWTQPTVWFLAIRTPGAWPIESPVLEWLQWLKC